MEGSSSRLGRITGDGRNAAQLAKKLPIVLFSKQAPIAITEVFFHQNMVVLVLRVHPEIRPSTRQVIDKKVGGPACARG